jgi:hypothetical protein
MLNKIKEFFIGKPKVEAPEAPYKVEAPSTDWPFPKASEIAPELAPVVATAPAKKAPAKPKAAPAVKPAVAAKKPRAKKTPAK